MLLRPPVRLRDVLLQYEKLWHADGETYTRALGRLWDALVRNTRDEAIGAHLGAQFSPLEYSHSELILSAPTVRDAVARGFAFYNAANPHSAYASDRRAAGTALSVRHERPSGTVRQDTENRLALLAALVRWFDPLERAPLAVRLRAPRPSYDAQLQAAFGCPVAYGQDEDAVIVSTEALDSRIWGSDHAARRLRELHTLSAVPPRPSATLKERVEAAILQGLSTGHGGKKHVAPELGASPRTLERWLAEAGVSFREILDEVRLNRCLQLLQVEDLPYRELAALLGFSSFSNFRRAFCRWFAPEFHVLAKLSRAGAGSLRPASRPRDMWVAAYGPRPCPFASPACGPRCAIHPAAFAAQDEADSA